MSDFVITTQDLLKNPLTKEGFQLLVEQEVFSTSYCGNVATELYPYKLRICVKCKLGDSYPDYILTKRSLSSLLEKTGLTGSVDKDPAPPIDGHIISIGCTFHETKVALEDRISKIPALVAAIEEARIIHTLSEQISALTSDQPLILGENERYVITGRYDKERKIFHTLGENQEKMDQISKSILKPFNFRAGVGFKENIKVGDEADTSPDTASTLEEAILTRLRNLGIQCRTSQRPPQYDGDDNFVIVVYDRNSLRELQDLCSEYKQSTMSR